MAKLLKVVSIGNKLFALMPYYNSNLRKIIKDKKRLELEDAKIIIINILAAVYCAYKNYRIIHQDLKPENILIDFDLNTREERFYVSDWGIANLQKKYCSDVPTRNWLPPSFVDTMSGMGTLPYMSPERFLGYPSDITCDIYSIGMIFFELIFGQLPYNYKSQKHLIDQILQHEYFQVAEYLLGKTFDNKVTKLILKCIYPDKKERYNDYKKLVVEVYNLGQKKRKFFFF